MDKTEETWIAECEQKEAQKELRRNIIKSINAVQHEWTCECGCVLKWDCAYARNRHYRSKKHNSRKNTPKIEL